MLLLLKAQAQGQPKTVKLKLSFLPSTLSSCWANSELVFPSKHLQEARTALEPRTTSAQLLSLGQLPPIYLKWYDKKSFIFANKDSLMKAASVLFLWALSRAVNQLQPWVLCPQSPGWDRAQRAQSQLGRTPRDTLACVNNREVRKLRSVTIKSKFLPRFLALIPQSRETPGEEQPINPAIPQQHFPRAGDLPTGCTA